MKPRSWPSLTRWAFGAAAAVRLAFVVFLPLADDGNSSYTVPALGLLSGHYSDWGTLHRLPAAPVFFALCYAVLGHRDAAVAAAQHLLGLGTFALVVSLAKRAWGERAAAATAWLLALQWLLPFQECFLLSESVAQFWLAAALWLAAASRQVKTRPWRWALTGAAAGIAALTRGELTALGPIISIFLAWPRSRPGRYRAAGICLAAWLTLVGGWTARNKVLFGYAGLTPDAAAVLLDTALPLVRYDLPTYPEAKRRLREDGASREESGSLLSPKASAPQRLERELGYSYLQARLELGAVAREAIRTQPLRYAKLYLLSLAEYLLPFAWIDGASLAGGIPAAAQGARGAAAAFWCALRLDQWVEWPVVLLAALLPLAWIWTRPDRRWLCGLLAATYWALVLLVAPSASIQRSPAELQLLLIPLAAFVADRLASAGRERWRRLRLAVRVAVSALVAAPILCSVFLRAASSGVLDDQFRQYYVEIYKPIFSSTPAPGGALLFSPSRAAPNHAKPFLMPKPPGTFRIFIAGGSVGYFSTYWPNGGDWAEELARLAPGRKFEVINVGFPAYDSYRDSLNVRELVGYSPDLIVLMSGNNEFLAPSKLSVPRFANVLLVLRNIPGLGALLKWLPAPQYTRARRDAEFEENLRDMVAATRGVAPLILCTLPNNLADGPPPGKRALRDPSYLSGWEALEEGQWDAAELDFSDYLKKKPADALAHFYLGRADEGAGKTNAANAEYAKAADLSAEQNRCPPQRNAMIRSLAREAGLPLADLDAAFRRVDPRLGEKVFYDGVHWAFEYNPYALASITAAVSDLIPGLDRKRLALWIEKATRPKTGFLARRYNLWRILVIAASASHSDATRREAVAALDRYEPGVLESLPRRREAFETEGLTERPWWGSPPGAMRKLFESGWPRLLTAAAAELRRRGHRDRALAYLDEASREAPNDPMIKVELSATLSRLGRRAEALAVLDEARPHLSEVDDRDERDELEALAACLQAGTCGLPR